MVLGGRDGCRGLGQELRMGGLVRVGGREEQVFPGGREGWLQGFRVGGRD